MHYHAVMSSDDDARLTTLNGHAPRSLGRREVVNGEASLARMFRDFGDRWEIEKVQRGTEWVAVQRETGGDYVRVVAAHDLHALRYRINEVDRDLPEEREPESTQSKSSAAGSGERALRQLRDDGVI
jgi:hypothetical protein